MSDSTFQQLQTLTNSLGVVGIVFAILWLLLPIVLFFKVWGMTNNVAEMKDTLKEWFDLEHPVVKAEEETPKDSAQLAN